MHHTTKIRREKLTISGARRPQLPREETTDMILDTRSLFRGARELKIKHNSDTYRLSITKLGKLILTK